MKLELYYPCKPYRVNQVFGVNGAYYRKNGININGHNGVDLKAYHGQPIYASADGYAYHQTDSSLGHGVVVVTDKEYDYKGGTAFFKYINWHMCDYAKEPKYKSPVLDYQQKNKGKPLFVKRGDLLGYADSTGLSSGDHDHYGLKPMKPGTPINPDEDAADVGIGNWRNLEQNNGYLGSIDPVPYFNGKFAQDTDQIVEANKIVVAIEDLEKVNPKGKDFTDTIIESLWKSFLAIFAHKK